MREKSTLRIAMLEIGLTISILLPQGAYACYFLAGICQTRTDVCKAPTVEWPDPHGSVVVHCKTLMPNGECGYDVTHFVDHYCPNSTNQDPTSEAPMENTTNRCGSIVSVEDQSLGESVPIVGTPFSIVYSSRRQQGFIGKFSPKIPVFGGSINNENDSATVTIQIAGTTTQQDLKASPWGGATYTWNGKNSSGSTVLGSQTATISIAHYETNIPPGSYPLEQRSYGIEDFIGRTYTVPLGGLDAKLFGLGGWDLNVHHFLDITRQTLERGDGSSVNVKSRPFSTSTGELFVVSPEGDEAYVFNSEGRHLRTITALTGALIYKFTYDGQGRLSQVADAFNNLTKVTNPTATSGKIVGPYGQATALVFNADGYLTGITPAGQPRYSATYKGHGGLLETFTKPTGEKSTFEYDAQGRLTRDSSSAGPSLSLVRTDTSSNEWSIKEITSLLRETNHVVRQSFYPGEPHPDVYKWDYPAAGGVNLNIENHALGTNENTSPLKVQTNISTTSDPRFGEMLKYESARDIKYPSNKTLSVRSSRQATLADANNPFSVQTYSEALTLNALSAGSSSFDRATSTMTTTSAKGRVQKVKLDAFERPVSLQRATFTPVTYAYDTRGRLWKTTQGTRVTTLTYNTKGLVATITNPASEKTAFTYNAADQVLTQTLPDTRVITYGYDTAGNRTSVTPPGKPAHGFLYDLLQEVISYIAPDIVGVQRTTTYAYDNDRALKQITRPNGTILTLTYHPASGLLKTIEAGSVALRFEYQNSLLNSASSPDGYTSTFTYDGDLLRTVSTPRLGDLTLDYSGPYMRLTSVQVNGLTPTTLHYDDDGLIDIAGAETLTRNATTGLVSSTTLGKVKETFTYSSFGESKTYKATVGTTVLLAETYTRDNLGRIKTRAITSKSTPTLETLTYTYDNSGRLKSVSSDLKGATVYTYDSNSNRFTVTRAGQTVTAAYDDQDRLLSSGNKTYSYNDNGELIKQVTTSGSTSTTVSYTYDVFGNLKSVTLSPTKTVSYEYDASNRRIARLVNSVVKERYLYLTQTQIAAVIDGSGNVLATFVYGEKQTPEYMVKSGVTYKLVTDPIGSVRMVVNSATGAIAQELTYDEFGRVLMDSKPGFQPLGFAGGLYDTDTKLAHFGARDYDAEIGRWTSKDPILFNGGDTNLYGYVLQDPVNWIDPAGLARCSYSVSTQRLVCTSNDGSQTIGLNANMGVRPLPEGHYDIRKAPGQTQGNWFLDPGLLSRIGYRLGLNRGGFNIHLPGQASEGCISVPSKKNPGTGIQDLDALFGNEAGSNTLEVVH